MLAGVATTLQSENDENSDAIILSAFNLWLCLDNTTGL